MNGLRTTPPKYPHIFRTIRRIAQAGKRLSRVCAFVLTSTVVWGMSAVGAYAGDYPTISAVGDIMMGTTFPRVLLPPDDGAAIFDAVKEEFKGSDIVFGNLEGPLIDGGESAKCGEGGGNCYEFRTPVRYVSHLKNAGFNVMNIANNHAMDFGSEGVSSTIDALTSAGISAVGGKAVAYLTVADKRAAVAGFSFSSSTPYSYPINNIPEAVKIVGRLKDANDIVIVSFHGGAEGKAALHVSGEDEIFLGEHRGNAMRFARSVIDAGADMVIGHGPHVLRALEIYEGKLIVYSLGNFLTYERFNIGGPNGVSVILKARIDPETGKFIDGALIPIKLRNGGIPAIDPEREAIGLVKKLTDEDIDGRNLVIADDGALRGNITAKEVSARADAVLKDEK